MRNRRFQAFTLIEIMIVIAIIAILAGILVPNYRTARAEAKLAACKQNIMQIAQALEMSKIRNPDIAKQATMLIDEDCLLVQYGYLKGVKKCPIDDCYYRMQLETVVKGNTRYNSYFITHGDAGFMTSKIHKSLGYQKNKEAILYFEMDGFRKT